MFSLMANITSNERRFMAMFLPVRIYAGMKIAQIYFETVMGEKQLYKGRYQNQAGVKGPEPLIINQPKGG